MNYTHKDEEVIFEQQINGQKLRKILDRLIKNQIKHM